MSLATTANYEINVIATEMNEEVRQVEKIVFTWKSLKGNTTTEKLRYILSAAKTRSIKYLDDPSKSTPIKVSLITIITFASWY